MRISLSDEAEADANAATDWYVADGAILAAEDFANAIERAFARLIDFPHIGKRTAHEARMLTLHDFPYSVIYRIHGDEVRIIAIAHHSRRPGYWAGRR